MLKLTITAWSGFREAPIAVNPRDEEPDQPQPRPTPTLRLIQGEKR